MKQKHERPLSSMTDADIHRYVSAAQAMADAAAAVTLAHFRAAGEVDDKNAGGKFDPVTLADRDAEAAIRQLIAEKFPDDGIIGEEHGRQMGEANWVNRNYWVIDPIDGTRSFISGIPLWGTLIAVNDGSCPVIGVIDHPAVGERFIGSAQGAFMNGKPIKARACANLGNATLSTTDPDLLGAGAEREAFFEVAKHVRLKRYGYDCYAYAMVAAGHMDLVIEAGLQIYDVQALMPVIEAAGGIITDWQGNSPAQGGRVVAAGDARIHAAALEILSRVD